MGRGRRGIFSLESESEGWGWGAALQERPLSKGKNNTKGKKIGL